MKKIIIAAVALSAFAGAASAERNYDLRDSDTYRGKFSNVHESADVNALAIGDAKPSVTYFNGKYGMTTNQDDVRRWDEKNG